MPATSMHSLTSHELRVAALVARGLTNVEIGAELAVSPKTVESHLSSIYRKLELRSRTELALHIVRAGGLPDPGGTPRAK
jgi:DNA-binding NarL/FixJ family response regulator